MNLIGPIFEQVARWTPGIGGVLHWIVLLPLLGAILNGLLGKRLGRTNVNLIGCAAVFGAFLISFAALAHVSLSETVRLRDDWWEWFALGNVPIGMSFAVDRLAATMICVVTGVGFLIHVYSTEYMGHDESPWRYFAYLNLFIAMMSTLVLGANLVVMFVGWEGVGLASYLLIGYWYTDEAKAYAGRKAFIVNRIGDFGFVLGIFTLVALFGTVDFAELQSGAANLSPKMGIAGGLLSGWTIGGAITLACLLLFLGATGKSAQFPLYIWLPDAMAGPTPVSALIHAATMVTAGVYMVCRMSFLYAYAPAAMATVAVIGAFTAILAALIAFTQNDIKKVLAYSTVSQLGFMFMAAGVGAYWAAIFHVVTHAFFKACLFLGAGAVMHGMKDETDIRKFGGLRHEMFHTWVTFGVATIAITGILPLSGFFSKDAILHAVHVTPNPWYAWVPTAVWIVGLTTAGCTAFYMWRMVHMTFHGERRGFPGHHAHDSGMAMTAPLWILAGLAVGAAAWGLPGEHGPRFARFLDPVFRPATASFGKVLALQEPGAKLVEAHGWSDMLPGYGIALAIGWAGFGLATLFYLGALKGKPATLAQSFPRVYGAMANKFYVDEIYDWLFVTPLKATARVLYQVVDTIAIDKLLVNGVANLTAWIAGVVRYFQNGDVQRYAAVMAVSLVVMLWIFLG